MSYSPWIGKVVKGDFCDHYSVRNEDVWSGSRDLCHKDNMFRVEVADYGDPVVAWGYDGAGPRQLALHILIYAVYWYINDRDYETLPKKYSAAFTKEVVSQWGDEWTITPEEVADWIKKKEAENKPKGNK